MYNIKPSVQAILDRGGTSMDAAVILTYRCNARCQMCHTWKYPSRREQEITIEDIEKLPSNLEYVNITGGEPTLRDDLVDIVGVLSKKARKVEISTNGYFTNRLVEVAKKYTDIRIRVSVQGLPRINN